MISAKAAIADEHAAESDDTFEAERNEADDFLPARTRPAHATPRCHSPLARLCLALVVRASALPCVCAATRAACCYAPCMHALFVLHRYVSPPENISGVQANSNRPTARRAPFDVVDVPSLSALGWRLESRARVGLAMLVIAAPAACVLALRLASSPRVSSRCRSRVCAFLLSHHPPQI